MFLRAGLLSLVLLAASRLLGLLRETALAAAFGASGQGDVAVLMLSLPDWLAGVLASGALAYVMLPAWAAQTPGQVAWTQRRLERILLAAGALLGIAIALLREELLDVLAPGLQGDLRRAGAFSLFGAAAAFPLALLASLWSTRLQHERRFGPMYGANLVVNLVLIATLWLLAGVAWTARSAVTALALGLLAAMMLRLTWLRKHLPAEHAVAAESAPMPEGRLWLWAGFAAGLPLALPFAARSIASGSGEGALATFNYAWKLVELPLMLAIQLAATLAFPAIAKALAEPDATAPDAAPAVRPAFALAWTLACAAAAALMLAAPAIAQILFGWGRMDARSLVKIADWARIGAWGLLPQAIVAVALTALAARRRMHPAVWAYAAALAGLFVAAATGLRDGAGLMLWLNGTLVLVALVLVLALGRDARLWLPWRALFFPALVLGGCALAANRFDTGHWPMASQLVVAAAASAFVFLVAFVSSADLRRALRR